AATARRATSGPQRTSMTLVDGTPPPRRPQPGGSATLRGQTQQRVQQHVGAALDRVPVAHLVDAMTAAAVRRDEDHARLGDAGEILRVVARRGVEAARRETERRADRFDRLLHAWRARRRRRRGPRPYLP